MTRPCRIVVIDDSATCVAMIKMVVEADGHWDVVGSAITARDAMGLIERLKPDVVTLDWELNGPSGGDALTVIREQFQVPVVVVSASTRENSVVANIAMANGAYACFDKTKLFSDSAGFLRTLTAAAHGGSESAFS